MDTNITKCYIAIDLKSFFASVECVERALNPMTAHLVVADHTRTEKTICLAVTPSLKAYGISGRARLFEVVERVKQVNLQRKKMAGGRLTGKSADRLTLEADPTLALDYLVAPPRMALYMEYSVRIFKVYLRHVAPEDIHVYSIDEVFIDATSYLKLTGLSAREFARRIIKDVLEETGITATAGIGTNLYLCKVALDIMAKHAPADENGVRIAELDEMSYRRALWEHRPLTDFWRIGKGYAKTLEKHGMYTMGDVARCSIGRAGDYYNEELLYRLFGVNAELLIDHAWGWEPCTIADIKAYKPDSNSLGSGQVLKYPYRFDKAKLVVREMVDLLTLELVEKGFVTDQIVLTVGYDVENLTDPKISKLYKGPTTKDFYGREVPKHAHGSVNLGGYTSSTRRITDAVMELYDRIVNKNLVVRRLNVTATHVIREEDAPTVQEDTAEQLNMFVDYDAVAREKQAVQEELERERTIQKTVIALKQKYGKNAILKGMNLEEGATAKERNEQIGGHKA